MIVYKAASRIRLRYARVKGRFKTDGSIFSVTASPLLPDWTFHEVIITSPGLVRTTPGLVRTIPGLFVANSPTVFPDPFPSRSPPLLLIYNRNLCLQPGGFLRPPGAGQSEVAWSECRKLARNAYFCTVAHTNWPIRSFIRRGLGSCSVDGSTVAQPDGDIFLICNYDEISLVVDRGVAICMLLLHF